MKKLTKNEERNYIALMQESMKLQLRDIRLTGSQTKLGEVRPQGLPLLARQDVSFDVGYNKEQGIARVIAEFKFGIRYTETDEDPTVLIAATFVILYSIPDFESRATQEATQRVALLNVWPFWREFVQSSSTRMGLPAFPLPLMNAAQLKLEKKPKKN
jgi:hypothetical protein